MILSYAGYELLKRASLFISDHFSAQKINTISGGILANQVYEGRRQKIQLYPAQSLPQTLSSILFSGCLVNALE